MIFVLVLFDPARSADPPMSVLFFLNSELIIASDDFLEAKLLFSFTASFFSLLIAFLKIFLKKLFILILFFL